MSNAPKKKEDTNVSGIFSITANPFEEGEIPGVTELLTRKQIDERQKVSTLAPTRLNIKTLPKPELEPEKPAAKLSAIEIDRTDTKTNLVVLSTISLKEFGVLFELRFHAEGSVFRYASSQGHKEAKLLPWQEQIFTKIKMDKKSVSAKEPFQEFKADENPFLFDAFAIQTHHYIQIVSPEYSNSRIVLVSDRSVVSHTAQIIEHFSRG